jgi:hypothetical protein
VKKNQIKTGILQKVYFKIFLHPVCISAHQKLVGWSVNEQSRKSGGKFLTTHDLIKKIETTDMYLPFIFQFISTNIHNDY